MKTQVNIDTIICHIADIIKNIVLYLDFSLVNNLVYMINVLNLYNNILIYNVFFYNNSKRYCNIIVIIIIIVYLIVIILPILLSINYLQKYTIPYHMNI